MKLYLKSRISNLQHLLRERGYDACIIMDRANAYYLTDFSASFSIVIVDQKSATVVTDPRYGEAAAAALDGFNVIIGTQAQLATTLKDFWQSKGYKTAAVEGSLSLDSYAGVRRWTKGAKLKADSSLLAMLRLVKDNEELKRLRRAVKLGDEVMKSAIAELRPGLTEWEVSRRIRQLCETNGGRGESFPCIVASGPNSSKPHHHPSERKLRLGDVVTLDLGVLYGGYCSDITRTVVLGKIPKGFDDLYATVLEANRHGIAAAIDGAMTNAVDAAARNHIAERGYGEYFGHGTGHGVGIEIHEAPRLGPAKKGTPLPPGAVVTVEPGIYIPGKYGCRIEDMILITTGKCKVLTDVPKALLVL